MPRFKDYYTLVEGWKCDFRQKVFFGPSESHSIDYRLLSSHVRPTVLLPTSSLSFAHSLPFGKGIQFLNSQCRWLQLSLSLSWIPFPRCCRHPRAPYRQKPDTLRQLLCTSYQEVLQGSQTKAHLPFPSLAKTRGRPFCSPCLFL